MSMFIAYENEVEPSSWRVLPQYKNTKTLLNRNGEFQLQGNVCPHQGSLIRQGTGTGLAASCPYHGYTWNQDGQPQGSGTVGHSKGTTKCPNTTPLTTDYVCNWNGFLFDAPIPVSADIAGDYKLEEYRQDRIKANYVPIMDLFLDIDHIPLVHKGVYNKIDIPDVKDVEWKSWWGGSAQFVIGQKAIWLALYPGVMFEYQPGAVFIMVNEAVSDTETISHVYKYRDYNYDHQTWITNSAIWEQAWAQDRAQAELLEPGWRTIPTENYDQEKRNFRGWIWNQKLN